MSRAALPYTENFNEAVPPDPSKTHIPALDGIRGVAILLVVAVHAFYRGPDIDPSALTKNLFIFGWTGVELFFVLSGFLITSLIKDEISKKGGLRNFFVKRASRIFPLYYGLLVFLFAVSFLPLPGALKDSLLNYRDNMATYWTFTSNYSELLGLENELANKILGPTWSLAIEEQYYLVWPLVLLLAGHRSRRFIPIALFVLLVVGRFLFSEKFDSRVVYHATFFHADGILIGSAIALWMTEILKVKKWLLPIFVLYTISLISIFFIIGTTHYSHPLIQKYCYALISIFYGLLLINTLTLEKFGRVFESRALATAGKYAYFIYLAHWPLLLALDQLPLPQGWVSWSIFFVTFCLCMIALGKISWNIFEQPASKMIRARLLQPSH
jgi:peptidoglycan/LPS O-acetylase OafA/YrhL